MKTITGLFPTILIKAVIIFAFVIGILLLVSGEQITFILSLPCFWLGWKMFRAVRSTKTAGLSQRDEVLNGLAKDSRFQSYHIIQNLKEENTWQKRALFYGPILILLAGFLYWAGIPITRNILVWIAPKIATTLTGAI